jgi:hypothetical protein
VVLVVDRGQEVQLVREHLDRVMQVDYLLGIRVAVVVVQAELEKMEFTLQAHEVGTAESEQVHF